MKDTIKVSWYIIVSTMVLTMFVLVSMSWGHSVNDSLDNYSWKDYACEHRMHDDYDIHHNHTTSSDEYGNPILGDAIGIWHWHKHATTDNGDLLESYKDKHKGDLSVSHSADAWTSTGCSDEEEYDVEPSDSGNNPSVPPAEVEVVTPATVTRTPRTPARSTVSQQLYYPGIVREPEVEVAPQCEEIELQVFLWWGETLLAPPVLPAGVETFADLWDAWGLSIEKGNKIKILVGNRNAYDDVSAEDEPFTPNQGLVIEQTIGNLLNLKGCPVKNSQKILIQKGYNLVGFPEVPDLFELPSDFLSNKIVAVKVQVGTPWGALYHTIDAVDDEGDDPIRAGQAVILTSTEPHWVNLSEPPAAAPRAPRQGTLATSWGAMKR